MTPEERDSLALGAASSAASHIEANGVDLTDTQRRRLEDRLFATIADFIDEVTDAQ